MKRAVAALTLAVSVLTPAFARGDEPAPPPAAPASAPVPVPAPAAEPSRGTPLSVRPSRPVELAPEPPRSRYGTAFLVLAALIGGGYWVYRRRSGAMPVVPVRTIKVSARRAIGVRSELLVVEIDGQSLLLGVTPGSIQRLAVLPDLGAAEKVLSDDVEPGFRLPLDLDREGVLDARLEARGDHKPEPRGEHRPEPRSEHRPDPRASLRPESRGGEPRPDLRGELRPDPPRGEPRRAPAPASTSASRGRRADLPVEEQVRGLLRRQP